MLKSKNTFVALASLLVFAVIVAGLWLFVPPISISFAQSPTDTQPAPASSEQAPSATEQVTPSAAPKAAYKSFFQNSLANHLGTTTDTLKSAYKAAFKDTLDQAVTDGKLTQDQANLMEARYNDRLDKGGIGGFLSPFRVGRRPGFMSPFFGRRGMYLGKGSFEIPSFAKALNMTKDELTTELQNGKTISAVAQEKSVDPATLKTNTESNLKATLDQAVKDGKMSQSRADEIFNKLDGNYNSLINQTWQNGRFRLVPVMP